MSSRGRFLSDDIQAAMQAAWPGVTILRAELAEHRPHRELDEWAETLSLQVVGSSAAVVRAGLITEVQVANIPKCGEKYFWDGVLVRVERQKRGLKLTLSTDRGNDGDPATRAIHTAIQGVVWRPRSEHGEGAAYRSPSNVR